MEQEKVNTEDETKSETMQAVDISDTFGKLKRKVSGQKFKDMARKGWQSAASNPA